MMAPPSSSATLFINHTLSSVIRDEFIASIAPPFFVAKFSIKYTCPLINAVEANKKMAPPAAALLPEKKVHVVLTIASDPRSILMAPPTEFSSLAVLFRKELQPVIVRIQPLHSIAPPLDPTVFKKNIFSKVPVQCIQLSKTSIAPPVLFKKTLPVMYTLLLPSALNDPSLCSKELFIMVILEYQVHPLLSIGRMSWK